jgi:TolB protein
MNRLLNTAGVAAAALACVLAVSGPAAATPAAPGRLLVLDAGTTGQGLVSVRPDGSGQLNLDLHVPYYAYPDLSPDGTRIVYTDGLWSIYTMDATGGDRQRLIDMPAVGSDPRWSPDGDTVGFESEGIWTVGYPSPGTGAQRVVSSTDDGQFLREPILFDWSPDGSRLAIVRVWQSGGDAQTPVDSEDIWIARADGSRAERQLTRRGASWKIQQLSWSPDGRTLAVAANDDLWSVDTRTGATTDLTGTPAVTESNPIWSPDGRRIAFGRQATGDSGPGVWIRRAGARGDAGHSISLSGQPTSWR